MPAMQGTGEPSQSFTDRPGPPRSRPLLKKKPYRRSPHACDECRLRKRGCDASEPCGPCRNSNLNCTYHFRRPAPPPTLRIRNLQHHLRLARSWLQEVRDKVPEVPGLDVGNCLRILDFTLPEAPSPSLPLTSYDHGSDQTTLSNMLAGCDRFINGSPGVTCFYGAYSELSFILRTLEVFEQAPAVSADERFMVVSNLFSFPFPPRQDDVSLSLTASLPHRDAVMKSIDALFARNHPMLSFIPEKHIRDVANQLTGPPNLSISDQDLSLFHLTLALGYLFDSPKHREGGCHDVLQRATKHFHAGLSSLRPIQVNNLTSLQSTLCAIIFLLSTSRMTSAHSLIGTACSSSLRLGLHSTVGKLSVTSSEEDRARTRLFATVMRLDLFASLILDLPPFLHRDTIPLSHTARLASEAEAAGDLQTAAALRQVCLLTILSKRIYGFVESSSHANPKHVDFKHFEEAQKEFLGWKMDASSLLASLGYNKEHRTIKHDLEMTYSFGQIILSRPFLHYLQIMADGGSISVTQSYHALACIKLASSTIVRAHETINEGLLLTGLWPSIYTIFLSVMCLIFLIAAHHGTSRPSKAWQRAAMGIRIIEGFKCVDDCSSRCLEVLKMVITDLSHTVYFDFDEMEAAIISNCAKITSGKSSQIPSSTTTNQHDHHEDLLHKHKNRSSDRRTSTWLNLDLEVSGNKQIETGNEADRMLVQAEEMATEFEFRDMLHFSEEDGEGVTNEK